MLHKKHNQFIGLTIIDTGLPFPGPILNYQAQKRGLEKRVVIKKAPDNTVSLTNLLKNQILIGDSHN